MKIKKKLSLTSYCYLLPCMLVFAVFLFYPFVKTVYLSLFKTNKYGQAKLFVGLENYTDLLTSASFQNSLKVTINDLCCDCCAWKYVFGTRNSSFM